MTKELDRNVQYDQNICASHGEDKTESNTEVELSYTITTLWNIF